MWPEPGSGFEASPYSPAGELQGMSRVTRGLGRRATTPRWARVTAMVLAGALLLPFAISLFDWLLGT
jgi:hypothetical protein